VGRFQPERCLFPLFQSLAQGLGLGFSDVAVTLVLVQEAVTALDVDQVHTFKPLDGVLISFLAGGSLQLLLHVGPALFVDVRFSGQVMDPGLQDIGLAEVVQSKVLDVKLDVRGLFACFDVVGRQFLGLDAGYHRFPLAFPKPV